MNDRFTSSLDTSVWSLIYAASSLNDDLEVTPSYQLYIKITIFVLCFEFLDLGAA